MQEVSEAYILGIKEGRDYQQRYSLTKQEIIEEVATIKRCMHLHSNEMKEMFRGQLHFWQNQIKKGKGHD